MAGPYAEAQALALPTTTGAIMDTQLPGELLGYTVYETSGSAGATVLIYDSSTGSALGPPLECIKLVAGASDGKLYQRPAKLILNGLWVVITGAVAGSVFH